MKPFIFGARNGIHVIDLTKTIDQLQDAGRFLSHLIGSGGKVLVVGTKKPIQEVIKGAATSCGQPYVAERWLGGTLTNLKTIRRSIKRLNEIEKMETDGLINAYVKQEQSMLRREAARLRKNLDGIRLMDKYPEAMLVVDVKREHNAVAEARRLRIPIVAIVDTNCDPDLVDYPIAGNDDSIRSVRIILNALVEEINVARTEYEARFARRAAEEAPPAEPAPAEAPAAESAPGAESAGSPEATSPETAAPQESPAPAPAPAESPQPEPPPAQSADSESVTTG